MRLFIAEKPNVGTSIAAQLGVKERKDGYLVTKTGDLVTWCFGHLMELAEPDAYLDKNVPEAKNGKVWREQDLPIFPQQWIFCLFSRLSTRNRWAFWEFAAGAEWLSTLPQWIPALKRRSPLPCTT